MLRLNVLMTHGMIVLLPCNTRIPEVPSPAPAATRIQSAWRGHCGRVLAKHHRYAKLAATDIQRVWRGYWVRQHLKVYDHAKRNYHALMIQRLWRGYRVRRCPDFNPAKVRAAILIQAWPGVPQACTCCAFYACVFCPTLSKTLICWHVNSTFLEQRCFLEQLCQRL